MADEKGEDRPQHPTLRIKEPHYDPVKDVRLKIVFREDRSKEFSLRTFGSPIKIGTNLI